MIAQLSKVATCKRVEGVQIDESELSSLEEMIKEAGWKEPTESMDRMSSSGTVKNDVITRQSLTVLAGDENDLLSESPVFQKAKGVDRSSKASPFDQHQPLDEDEIENIDEQLINEIEDYLKGVMENNE